MIMGALKALRLPEGCGLPGLIHLTFIVAWRRIEDQLLVEPFLFSTKGHKFRLLYANGTTPNGTSNIIHSSSSLNIIDNILANSKGHIIALRNVSWRVNLQL